jgi:hypothetical protein
MFGSESEYCVRVEQTRSIKEQERRMLARNQNIVFGWSKHEELRSKNEECLVRNQNIEIGRSKHEELRSKN